MFRCSSFDPEVGSTHLALKPTLGMFAGLRGNKAFRCTADTMMRKKNEDVLRSVLCFEKMIKLAFRGSLKGVHA